MKRNIIAIAVSAALVAPAAMADTQVGGKVRLSYGAFDVEEGGVTTQDNWELQNRASRLFFKGSEELGNGLNANFFVEWGINPDSGSSDGLSSRNQWVGLSGGWGEVRFGRHDTPLKFAQGKVDVFNDQVGDWATKRFSDDFQMLRGDDRIDNVLAYVSPNFNGFGGAIALVPGEDDTGPQDGAVDIWSGNLTYSNGPIFASIGHTDLDAASASGSRDTTTRIVGTYKFGAAQIGAVYEMNDYEEGAVGLDEYDVWGLSGKYSFGNNAVKAQYLSGESENQGFADEDSEQISLGFDHNFSKRTSVYAEYTMVEHEDAGSPDKEHDFYGVGINHNF